MAEWGRKEYSKAWPSRRPVWTWTAIFLSFVFFAGMLTLEYERSWTAAERLYLSDYLKSGARGKASATVQSKYTLLEAVVGKGQQRLVIGDEIEPVPGPDGRLGYRLTDEGVKDGISRLTWVADIAVANRLAHEVLGRSLDELPPQTRRLLLAVDEMVTAECERQKMERADYRFSRRDVRAATGWGDTQLKIHLHRLEELEYLLIHRGGRGQSIVYELMFTRPSDGGKPVLGGLIDIEKLGKP